MIGITKLLAIVAAIASDRHTTHGALLFKQIVRSIIDECIWMNKHRPGLPNRV